MDPGAAARTAASTEHHAALEQGPGRAGGPGVKAREQGAPAALPNNGNTI